MANEEKQPLKVFLCHASGDKPAVRDLYKRLTAEGVDAWLDQEKLLPGQDWRMEIPKAVREADVVVICFSKKSITKEGYVQKEIKFALDFAEEKPDGAIFLIPARLEDCVIPERLSRWQWVDLFDGNGFIKLLRSLKLRADAVGATMEPTSYVDSDKELERRLEQYYTEGLAAFYTEDWDKACQRFQSILSEQPNHKNAAEKLAEAERQRSLSKLYEQATGAVRGEDWVAVIQSLEELTQKSAAYKDSAQLLKNARKQKQLRDLYNEAKALHAGKQWEAVVKVFEQISVVDPDYLDADELLQSAKVEVVELERLAALNDQYSQAVREMDSGNWLEARTLLEQIHKSQTGFRETEKLLKKVDNEIVMQDEQRKQNDQINTLYEQAHGLLRSRKWRNALDKMEEIRKLDDQFPDKDGIAEKVQKELAREEQEAERQNKLAALYAEAVRLLMEEKYQNALDKWQEVKAIDSKYPDRQRIQRTAKKKLSSKGKNREIILPLGDVLNNKLNLTVLLAAIVFGSFILIEQNINQWSQIDISTEIKWAVRGMVYGLTTVFVLRRVMAERGWRVYLTFGVSWAAIYLLTEIFFRNSNFLLSLLFSFAPVVSIFLSSLWVTRKIKWQTHVLILLGWLFAWLIGQNIAAVLTTEFRWPISYAISGGIGLWITADILQTTPLIFKATVRTGILLVILAIAIVVSGYIYQSNLDPFGSAVGEWESVDVGDGSYQTLTITRSLSGKYTIRLRDENASFCAGYPGASEFFARTNTFVINTTFEFICEVTPYKRGAFNIQLVYRSDADMLKDSSGITWTRKK